VWAFVYAVNEFVTDSLGGFLSVLARAAFPGMGRTGTDQRALISWSTALRIESSRLQNEKRTSQAGAFALR
jgi:hypothetical protein